MNSGCKKELNSLSVLETGEFKLSCIIKLNDEYILIDYNTNTFENSRNNNK